MNNKDLTDRILAQMDDDAAERDRTTHREHKPWFLGLPVSNDPWTRGLTGLVLLAIAPYVLAMVISAIALPVRAVVEWWNTPIVEVDYSGMNH